jgi:hypothetical protein
MFTRESWVIGFVRQNNPGLCTTAPLPRRRAGDHQLGEPVRTRSSKNVQAAWDFVNFIMRRRTSSSSDDGLDARTAGRRLRRANPQAPQFKAFFDAPENYGFCWCLPIRPFDKC